MSKSITIAPANSIVAIAEAPTATGPRKMSDLSIASTRSCIVVGCRMFMDGETRITFGQARKTDERPAFDGFLDTPGRKVGVWTVGWENLLEISVPTTRTRVRIWTNHPSEPDDVHVGVGE